jgi:hypothetical protein
MWLLKYSPMLSAINKFISISSEQNLSYLFFKSKLNPIIFFRRIMYNLLKKGKIRRGEKRKRRKEEKMIGGY